MNRAHGVGGEVVEKLVGRCQLGCGDLGEPHLRACDHERSRGVLTSLPSLAIGRRMPIVAVLGHAELVARDGAAGAPELRVVRRPRAVRA